MEQITFAGQVLLAMFLGAILGWQRARWGKSAGPRTFALVTVGSAVFTILARYGFAQNSLSSANIAAQIVSGISFLGVGLIFHRENHVDGLTTAAGLWTSAAIGMAVGLSFYYFAIFTTLVVFIILMMDEKKLKINNNYEATK
jgi:putative Mg2+ transporter-C (MgtC) family protein